MTITVPPDIRREIERIAREDGHSTVSRIARIALEEFVTRRRSLVGIAS